MRVVIVGAGPTGLTAAIELARRGIIPVVIDRKEKASTLSRAVGILPSSLRVLGPSGVTDRLLSEGMQVSGVNVFRGTRHALHIPFAGAHPDRDFVLALPQDRTEECLRDALTGYGGSVIYDAELTDIRQSDESAHAVTRKGDEYECDYILGADGIHSAVRKAAGIDYPGFDLPEAWSIADVDASDWPHNESFTLSLLPGGTFVGVIPLEAERYRVVSNTSDALAALPLDLDIRNTRREATFEISVRQAVTYCSGRVVLAGDAAHCHSPIGGRGMNLGIADAAELAQRLVAGTLDGYSASRHAAGAAVVKQSERARRFMTSRNIVTRALTRLAIGAVRNATFLQRRVARAILGG